MYNRDALKNINQTNDVDNLKIFLGGLKICSSWISCDTNCYIPSVNDDEILSLLELKEKHNLSFKDIMTLYFSCLNDNIIPYKQQYGILISELENEFVKFSQFGLHKKKRFANNYIDEKIFEKLILTNNINVCEFMKKYNLTKLDFIVLAKCAVHGFPYSKHIGFSDNLIPDLDDTLIKSLGNKKVKILKFLSNFKNEEVDV